MQKSLMVGLTEKDMQAVVNNYALNDFYYPTLFPLKENYTMTWKTLEINAGLRVAADLVARGASLDKKTREALTRIQGDLPKIAVKRTKDENELNEYDIMIAMSSGNADVKALVEAWAEDTNFCWNAVASRLEWMGLQSISKGKITLTNSNNGSVISEYDVDYAIPANRKRGTSIAWSNASTAKPLSVDFKNAVDAARAENINLKYAFMSLDTFATFAATAEVTKLSASFAADALGIAYTPSLDQVNRALAGLAYLRGLQIVVIDQNITIEVDGVRTSGNPFAENVVMFSESKVLGATYWKRPADMNVAGTAAYKALNGHTLIKKYSNEEPVEEVTVGIANAFPAWASSTRSVLLDTKNASWNAGE